mgnify:CR=1 FL=1
MHAYRSHTCNDLRATHVGAGVRLSGWVHRVRDHGGVLFIDLRDHYGITQIVADSDSPALPVLEANAAAQRFINKITDALERLFVKVFKRGTGISVHYLMIFIAVFAKNLYYQRNSSQGEINEKSIIIHNLINVINKLCYRTNSWLFIHQHQISRRIQSR